VGQNLVDVYIARTPVKGGSGRRRNRGNGKEMGEVASWLSGGWTPLVRVWLKLDLVSGWLVDSTRICTTFRCRCHSPEREPREGKAGRWNWAGCSRSAHGAFSPSCLAVHGVGWVSCTVQLVPVVDDEVVQLVVGFAGFRHPVASIGEGLDVRFYNQFADGQRVASVLCRIVKHLS